MMLQKRRSNPTESLLDQPLCKRRRRRQQNNPKKAVSFSADATLRRLQVETPPVSSWLTPDEILSQKKRAKNLSKIHYFKTHDDDDGESRSSKVLPSAPPTTKHRSGIVYNCHPSNYEIIGESLRGMEHFTDPSTARRREQMRVDVINLVQEYEYHDDESVHSKKLVDTYRELTNEAMEYALKMAEEDAKMAAAILEEDFKKQDDCCASAAPGDITRCAQTLLLLGSKATTHLEKNSGMTLHLPVC